MQDGCDARNERSFGSHEIPTYNELLASGLSASVVQRISERGARTTTPARVPRRDPGARRDPPPPRLRRAEVAGRPANEGGRPRIPGVTGSI